MVRASAVLVTKYVENLKPPRVDVRKIVVVLDGKAVDCEVGIRTEYRIRRLKQFRRLPLREICNA